VIVEELKAKIAALEANARGRRFSPAEKRDWNAWNEELAELEARTNRVLELAGNPNATVAGASFDVPGTRGAVSGSRGEDRDAGLRTIETYSNSGELRSQAADTLERLVRDPRDPMALSARYLDAVGDPAYGTAFAKILEHGTLAPLRFTPDEQAAVQKAN
jgi:hypothetical protein